MIMAPITGSPYIHLIALHHGRLSLTKETSRLATPG